MRIVSLNCHARLNSFTQDVLELGADVLLLQEWQGHSTESPYTPLKTIDLGEAFEHTRYLITTSNEPMELIHSNERFLVHRTEHGLVVNVYSPAANSPRLRRELLGEMTATLSAVDDIRAAKAAGSYPPPPKGSVDVKTCDACEWRWHCPSTIKTYKLNAP